jgi:hypothetical protein
MTAMVVSAQEAAEKAGRECKVSEFQGAFSVLLMTAQTIRLGKHIWRRSLTQ